MNGVGAHPSPVDFLTALGHDVEVRVTPTRKEHGPLSVVVAA